MDKIGTKIRIERKKSGLTLLQLAARVGVSLLTIQRIETGKSSPSVVLLSEIARSLNKSILSFLEDDVDKPFLQIKRKDQREIGTSALKVRLIGPRKMIRENIAVSYGVLRQGRKVDPHSHRGVEWAAWPPYRLPVEPACPNRAIKTSVGWQRPTPTAR